MEQGRWISGSCRRSTGPKRKTTVGCSEHPENVFTSFRLRPSGQAGKGGSTFFNAQAQSKEGGKGGEVKGSGGQCHSCGENGHRQFQCPKWIKVLFAVTTRNPGISHGRLPETCAEPTNGVDAFEAQDPSLLMRLLKAISVVVM